MAGGGGPIAMAAPMASKLKFPKLLGRTILVIGITFGAQLFWKRGGIL